MTPKRILVVDDEPFIRELIKDFLELESIECDEADDLPSVIRQLELSSYNLVLLDRNLKRDLPESIINKIRQKMEKVPIVILTGDHDCTPDEIKKIGADGIIYKPFQVNDFLHELSKYIS